ncbi:MAG: outer membrane protein assembly factor BamD [Myxococcales bacterium]|nr:outer membrane protein assembly factor BamD [Myxococcales bacterium]
MRFALIAALLFASVPASAQSVRSGVGSRYAKMSPVEIYERGLRSMRRGYYTKALEDFNRVRNYHRDDPISVKAQLAIADVYFKKHDYEQARFAYEEFATYHPRHENLDYVTFQIGMSIYKRAPLAAGRDQTATRSAVNIWSGFPARFPGSTYAPEVEKYLGRARNRLARKELRIARFYEDRQAWGAVQGRTEVLVRRFPESGYVPEAYALLAIARHAWGDVQGAQEARQNLVAFDDSGTLVAKVDRHLARPPGERPREEVFIRPYRVRGLMPQAPPSR